MGPGTGRPDRTGLGYLDVLGLVVDAATSSGDTQRAMDFLDVAFADVDRAVEPVRAAVLLGQRSGLLRELGRPEWIETIRAAVGLMPEDGSDEQANLLTRYAVGLACAVDRREGLAVSEQSLPLVRALGRTSDEIRVQNAIGAALIREDRIEEGLGHLAEAYALAEGSSEVTERVGFLGNVADAYATLGRHVEAASAARAAVALAVDVGLARTKGAFAVGNLSESLVALGEWEEADALTAEALERRPSARLSAFLHRIRAELLLGRGDTAAADAELRAARRSVPDGGVEAQYELPVLRFSTEIDTEAGRWDDVRQHAHAALPTQSARWSPRYSWPLMLAVARAELAACEVGAGDPAFVEWLREESRRHEYGQSAEARATRLEVGATLDRIAESDDVAQWAVVVQVWEEAALPLPLGQARVALAAAHIAAGDRTAAQAELRAAATVAVRLGADRLREQAANLARRAGVRLVDGVPSTWDGPPGVHLTAREREVLRLVASGRSNRQIAEELFISVKTASVHVSNILAKLGVSGRGEAAAEAHRLRLVDSA